MSCNGYDVPKVVVGRDCDQKLAPAGKRCAKEGIPNLPGGMMRCHSMPGKALTCPTGWLAQNLRRTASIQDLHQGTLRETSRHTASLHNGTWSGLETSLRPSTVAVERIAGGGRTQGARSMRPSTEGGLGNYDPQLHGWHDPRGQAETMRLNDPPAARSHAWTMRKARDHIGYGDDGMVNWGDIQTTAVSGDGPTWFVGARTVPGPFTTKTVPVKRCPFVHIEGQQMRTRGKTYEHGPNLSTVETLHPTNDVPAKPKRKVAEDMWMFNRAKYCSLKHGGCQTKDNPYPLSNHVVKGEGRRH